MNYYQIKNRHLILKCIREFGAEVRPDNLTHSKKYNIDVTYFEKVDTEDKAYFLGLLYADGYNGKSNSCIRLGLASPDEHILETFKKYLKTNKPLKFYNKGKQTNNKWKDFYNLDIENKKMCEDLEKLNCFQAKTHFLTFPNQSIVPKHLIRHFIRGFFDGDGCITSTRTKNKPNRKPTYSISFVTTLSFLESLEQIFIEELGFKKVKFSKRFKERKDSIYTFSFAGSNKVEKLYHYLYDNSNPELCLKRKKLKFEEFDKMINDRRNKKLCPHLVMNVE